MSDRARQRLSAATLPAAARSVALPAYRRDEIAIGVVHFGPGAFHRAHQAFYFDRLLGADRRWAVCDVALRGTRVIDALAAQDGLFALNTLAERAQFRVIGSIARVLSARAAPDKVFAQLVAPATRLVTVTVTENGYCLTRSGELDTRRDEIRDDLARPHQPSSLIGWICEAQRRRRDAGLAPLTVISCDNLADNGARLKRAVVQFALERNADLARWIEGEASFPRTMVDSIAPAPDEALKARVAAQLGLIDMAPVQREEFAQWVIEDLPGVAGPDWASAGVTVSSDVAQYERAKLRILNGAHSTLAYLGLLRGRQTTSDAMRDPALAAFVGRLALSDIAPSLRPGLDIAAYVETVLARIANPAITHYLGQIAWDGSQKIPYRLFGPLLSALEAGRPIARLCLPIAAWMRFVRVRTREGGELIDPLADDLHAIAQDCSGEGIADVPRFLALEAVFPRSLSMDARVSAAMATAYDEIGDTGRLDSTPNA